MKKSPLDKLATSLVGDGKERNIFFVTDKSGVVIAVFRDYHDAVEFAESEYKAKFIEDRLTGKIWER